MLVQAKRIPASSEKLVTYSTNGRHLEQFISLLNRDIEKQLVSVNGVTKWSWWDNSCI